MRLRNLCDSCAPCSLNRESRPIPLAHNVWWSREVLVGRSERGRLLVVSHAERGDPIRLISARLATALSGRPMKKRPSRQRRRPARRDTMRPEYDFSKGVRNKYAARLKPGGMLMQLTSAPS